MRDGVIRMLQQSEAHTLAGGRVTPEQWRRFEFCLGFQYESQATALAYRVQCEMRGYTVIGPFEYNDQIVNLVLIPPKEHHLRVV
jgi:hypothetical protein